MPILFLILIVVVCALLGLIVLIQNPKGGGLSGNIAGFSNQFMGVKQTTDVLEKGTWTFAAIVAILCLVSSVFMGGRSGGGNNELIKSVPTTQQQAVPQQLPSSQPATTPAQPSNPPPQK